MSIGFNKKMVESLPPKDVLDFINKQAEELGISESAFVENKGLTRSFLSMLKKGNHIKIDIDSAFKLGMIKRC